MFAILALAGAVSAYANVTTVEETKYTTIPCSTPTTLTYGSSTYTITEATTLTVEDCSCTNSKGTVVPVPSATGSVPALANGAGVAKAGAAAGVAAAVAYLL